MHIIHKDCQSNGPAISRPDVQASLLHISGFSFLFFFLFIYLYEMIVVLSGVNLHFVFASNQRTAYELTWCRGSTLSLYSLWFFVWVAQKNLKKKKIYRRRIWFQNNSIHHHQSGCDKIKKIYTVVYYIYIYIFTLSYFLYFRFFWIL